MYVGITGSDWCLEAEPLAYCVTLLSAEEDVLLQETSFLWRAPGT